MSCGGGSKKEDDKTVMDPPQARGDDGASAMETRFASMCKSVLSLDESLTKEAVTLFRECTPVLTANLSVFGSGSPEEVERYWSAFALYCVSKLRDEKDKLKNEHVPLTVSQILRVTKINLVDFYREIPQFLLKAGAVLANLYGSDCEKRLEVKEAQANFVHLKLLSNHYRRAYEEFFLCNDPKSSGSAAGSRFISEYHRFGWLLFLALRIHAFNRFKDLVTCTNGLVSILAILILHIPTRMRKFSILDSTRLVKKSEKGLDLLASLCDIYHTSEIDLRAVMEKTNSLIVGILKKEPCPASECQAESLANINLDGLTYFEGLMDEKFLQSSLLVLEEDYDDAIHVKGEIDERMFINDEDSLIGSGSLSGGALSICRPKGSLCPTDSPAKTIVSPRSPPQSPMSPAKGNSLGPVRLAPTPVTAAMTTAKWLRTVISPLSSRPSHDLEKFLSSCDRDFTNDVIRRANIILEAIFPSRSAGDRSVVGTFQHISIMDGIWAEQRKLEAMKLYYRVLEAICRAESHLLHANNLTTLLSNERFHRCMLACSAELVLATHKTVTIMFPAVLERTGITAFDLSKVIESFVRHEETLPRELKRHLNSLEERLLENLAWEKGSSMYNSLIVARPALAAQISRVGLLADPMPSLDSIVMHHNISNGNLTPTALHKHDSPEKNGDVRSPKRVCTEIRNVLGERNSFASPSPVKERFLTYNTLKSKLPHLQLAFATPTRPSPAGGGETCAEMGINIFFSKIVKLAAIRIRSLCEKMQQSHQILERVYCLIQQILNQQTSLFFNRHIDQLILCSFYGVAKISQLNLTFKEIINNYKKQPQCKAQVFRSVFIDWSLTSREGKVGQEHVDIITFYNEVFIPCVKPLLVELGPGSTMKNNRLPEDNRNTDGQCPGSPRLTPFPALPDMSPKKVSASHNVYVSPLRSSKMDTLLSPSSKSYYAFVGESTHAYQSPSKDLSAINNRLNCPGSSRKLRLNFDMVSDTLVAGSLCPQNGTSSVHSSAASKRIKTEQSDS